MTPDEANAMYSKLRSILEECNVISYAESKTGRVVGYDEARKSMGVDSASIHFRTPTNEASVVIGLPSNLVAAILGRAT